MEDYRMTVLRLIVLPLIYAGWQIGNRVLQRHGRIRENRSLEKRLMGIVMAIVIAVIGTVAILRFTIDLETLLPPFVRMHATHFKWWGVECLLALAFGFSWGIYRLEERKFRIRLLITGLLAAFAVGLGDREYTRPIWERCREIEKNGVIFQSTPSTCGPAAMANLLRRLGRKASERDLAHAGRTRRTGTTGDELLRAAERFFPDLKAAWLKPTLTEIEQAGVPCVLSLDEVHFITLIGKRGHLFETIDPSVGYCLMKEKDLLAEWDGKALFIAPAAFDFTLAPGNEDLRLPAILEAVQYPLPAGDPPTRYTEHAAAHMGQYIGQSGPVTLNPFLNLRLLWKKTEPADLPLP